MIKYFKGKKPKDYPTAIVCFNDQLALSIFMAFKELKIRLPTDISII